MASELSALETLLANADHALAVAAPLLVQVRRGAMTLSMLDILEQRVREVRPRFVAAGRRVAYVAVLEEGAPVAVNEVRTRQRILIEGLMEGLDTRVVAVVVGDGIASMLQRSVARGLLFANPRVRVAKSPEEAATSLAPHLAVTAAQIASVIHRVRDLR